MPYTIERGKVRFAGFTLRGADPATFEALLEPWARDKNAVFYSGRKVALARAAKLTVVSAEVAFDDKRLFYLPRGGAVVDSNRIDEKDTPFADTASFSVDHDERFAYLKSSSRVWVLGEKWTVCVSQDSSSFRALGQGYVKDALGVRWLDDEGYQRPLADADPATFTVDERGARDARGRFVMTARDETTLAVEGEADVRRAVAARAEALWHGVLPLYFGVFDSVLQNDGPWSSGLAPAEATRVPAHAFSCDRGAIEVALSGETYRTTLSALALAAGWLWAMAKGKGPMVRVLAQSDNWRLAGNEARWVEAIDLAYLVARCGERNEARLLLWRVLQEGMPQARPTSPEGMCDPEVSGRARARKLVPDLTYGLPSAAPTQGSKTYTAAASVVEQGLHTSPDPLVRRTVATRLADLVAETNEHPERLAESVRPLLILVDDPEPAVFASAALSFEALASKLVNKQFYALALPILDALTRHRVNLDWHSARRWECLAALGQEERAEEAWSTACALTRHDERQPRQHTGLHTDYPSLAVWRGFAELRLVATHADDEPRTRARIDRVRTHVAQWIAEEPGAVIGPLLTEVREAHARATGVDRIDEPTFVMHKQYVDFRRYAEPFRFDGLECEAYGRFTARDRTHFAHEGTASEVPAVRGNCFGIQYRCQGGPSGRVLPGRATVRRPSGMTTYPLTMYLGLKDYFVWTFDRDDELEPGEWLFTISVHDAERPHEFPVTKAPPPRAVLGSIERAFHVLPRG